MKLNMFPIISGARSDLNLSGILTSSENLHIAFTTYERFVNVKATVEFIKV